MSKKGSRASDLAVLFSAILLAATRATAGAPLTLTGWDARAVETARAGAVKRLASEECRKLFTDFRDAEGRSLQQNLEEWGASPAEYIGLIPFVGRLLPPTVPQDQRSRWSRTLASVACRVQGLRGRRAQAAPRRREHVDPRDPPHARPGREPTARRAD